MTETPPRTIAIGVQDFEKIILKNNFYIDKTGFIKEWWESDDEVTLIIRPRRFGKTLNMNMLERFFSIKFKEKGEIFKDLNIWKDEKYRRLQGTYPVIFLSFAGLKTDNYRDAQYQICQFIKMLYKEHSYLVKFDILTEDEKDDCRRMANKVLPKDLPMALHILSNYLYRCYGNKTIILIDEYDAPLQEAYVNGYWKEMVSLIRNIFNNTFKTNPYLERAVMTGVTRISKESMFSDLNNLRVITVTSNQYASYFGFTEEEVFLSMDEFGMTNKDEVKEWYDGFTIGNLKDIYNPWSVINFLKEKKLKSYWTNTSSNELASTLLKKSGRNIKMQFEELLSEHTIKNRIDEEVIFNQLDRDESAIWSLLLASGYLKVIGIYDDIYEFSLTNYEVKKMFRNMVRNWFAETSPNYNDFIKALLNDNIKEMNVYMNNVSLIMFSSFDGGTHPSKFTMPEKFYHGFVLGLLVDLNGRYEVTSNKESGLGRYDVMLRPFNKEDNGIILEFKVHDSQDEATLEETVQAALKQIEEKKYEQILINQGIDKKHIRKYGFAFKGKKVLIGSVIK